MKRIFMLAIRDLIVIAVNNLKNADRFSGYIFYVNVQEKRDKVISFLEFFEGI